MKRVILHWTAGRNVPNPVSDLPHYHFLISKFESNEARIVKSVPVERNEGRIKPGYAAHTRNCNTDSIGVSICGMAGAVQSPLNVGKYPFTEDQWALAIHLLADLCNQYKIPVTPRTVLSHAEVQGNLGIAQRGKWDISILPFDHAFNTAKKCGDEMRRKVSLNL